MPLKINFEIIKLIENIHLNFNNLSLKLREFLEDLNKNKNIKFQVVRTPQLDVE